MRLGGLTRTTTQDFPGLVAAVVFTEGCNFTCPYCHNPGLAGESGEPLDEGEVLAFLRRRRRFLAGVVVSGGEPTRQPDLADFCRRLRGLGYAVKLDTNGSRPERVGELIEHRLVDYLALDLKADPRRYPREIAPEDPGEAIMETVKRLRRSGLPHEFRVTAAAPFINRQSLERIARAAAGPAPLYLQPCRLESCLNPDFMRLNPPPGPDELEALAALAAPHLPTRIRGREQ